VIAAASGRHDDALRALRMLQSIAGDDEGTIQDLRTQLAILSGRMTLRDHRELIAILERIREQTTPTENELLQLASLYTRTNQWPLARPLYEELLRKHGTNPVYLSEFIAASLRQEPIDDGLAARLKPRLDRLQALEPSTMRTAVTAARFHNAFGRTEQAAQTLLDHAERATSRNSPGGTTVTAEERASMRLAAEVAEDLGLHPAAEQLFRRVAEHSERPEEALFLASYFGRRGRYAEALDVVETHAARANPEATAVMAANVISRGVVPNEQLDRAERLITAALETEPRSLRILSSLASLRSVQRRDHESEELYRHVLTEQPENVAVLNNLAWMLAVTGRKTDEAAELIEAAIRITGPAAALLDTRGTVEWARGHVTQAINDLQAAFEEAPSPYIGFHLALAFERFGNRDQARETLRRALEEGLSSATLHAAEHDAYFQLLDRLKVTAPQLDSTNSHRPSPAATNDAVTNGSDRGEQL
jgi:tetratricopeptide (TPR) repeat protein